jgi:hypothetical protein
MNGRTTSSSLPGNQLCRRFRFFTSAIGTDQSTPRSMKSTAAALQDPGEANFVSEFLRAEAAS